MRWPAPSVPVPRNTHMNYIEISREECSEALAKIITVLSEIILDPHENKTSVYPKAAEAFNGIADEVGFGGLDSTRLLLMKNLIAMPPNSFMVSATQPLV